jgi:NADPH2:quinone reductase
LVIPWNDYKEIPTYIEKSITRVGIVHMDISPDSVEGKAGVKARGKDFGFAYFRLFSRGLQEGWFTAHPHEVIPGGLYGVEKGLANLKGGVNSATKYIFKIGDIEKAKN